MPVLRWHLEREGVTAADDAQLEQIVLSQRERAKTVREMAANSLFFFRAPQSYDEKAVRKHVTAEVLALLARLTADIGAAARLVRAGAFTSSSACFAAAKGVSLGKLAQPIRLAVCGGTVSPPIDATLAILGKTEVIVAIDAGHGPLGARSSFIFLTNWRVSGNVPRLHVGP